MNCQQAREAILDALSGPVEPDRERAAERHLDGCAACAAEAASLRETWAAMSAADTVAVPSDRMRVRFRAALGAYEAQLARSWSRRLRVGVGRFGDVVWAQGPAARAALAAALLVVGVAIGWGGSRTLGAGREAARLRAELAAKNRSATIALLAHQSASERLRGVAWSADGGPDERVLAALVAAVKSDDSVNVRLAAVEALAAHLDRPSVRSGLFATLEQRPRPHLQLTVSRLLAGDESAAEEYRQLLASDLLDPEVRRLLLDESGEI